MSYNPNIMRDSKRYFYHKGSPVSWKKTSAFKVARDAMISRKFGGYNPFLKRVLDRGVSAGKWYFRNRRYTKYFTPWPYPYSNAKTKKSYTKFQKGVQSRSSFKSRRYQTRVHRRGGKRFCSCRTNRSYRYGRSYRKRNYWY